MVIAIIGILSSVVLASLNTARTKSRDSKRVSDMKQLQLALALYSDSNGGLYPTTLAGLAPTYISVIPVDPTGGSTYFYRYAANGTGVTCSSYHLGAQLEETTNQTFASDADAAPTATCTGSVADFSGADPIYDLKP